MGVSYDWPCMGKPTVIQADNAKEFRGNMLKRASQEHGFDIKFRKVKKPNYGGHIERLLGTLLKEIHNLEGATSANPQEKGEYDAQKNAVMTLGEFESWLANLILGKYHHREHSALKCSPLSKHEEGILGSDDVVGSGVLPIAADPEKLRIDFLPLVERTIQPYSVILDWVEYYAPVLDKWIGAREQNNVRAARKFIFRRDPRNISYLWFWDPDLEQYFKIPYRNAQHPAISLWELRAVQRFLKEQGRNGDNEEIIFAALDEMRRIEENAKRLTRKQRRMKQRRRDHKRSAQPPESSHNSNEEYRQENIQDLDFDLDAIEPFDDIEFGPEDQQ